jgi:adenylyltransferase and sulfurtransferase
VYAERLDVRSVRRLLVDCGPWDVVLDCTDNVGTRYCLNDGAVLAGLPLVSGAALRTDGQLTVYNYPVGAGLCMRCVFPTPPQRATSCSDGGVLGVVPGVIGCLQALEAIKLIVQPRFSDPVAGRMLVFDGLGMCWRVVRLQETPDPLCTVCGSAPSITWDRLTQHGECSESVCELPAVLPPTASLTCTVGWLVVWLGE